MTRDFCDPNANLAHFLPPTVTDQNGTRIPLDPADLLAYCHDAAVANFAALVTEMRWRCPERVYGADYTPSTTSHTNDSLAALALCAVFIVVGIVGFIGNLATVVVITRTPHLQTYTNYFLASLATSDMLLICVGVPFDVVSIWRKAKVPAIQGWCEGTSTAITWFTFTSILFILALTTERLVAICYPFSLKSWFVSESVANVIVGLALVAFLPSVLFGYQYKPVARDFCGRRHVVGVGGDLGACDFVPLLPYPFEAMLLLTFVLPMLYIVYCYTRILRTLNQMSSYQTVHGPVTTQSSTDSAHVPPSPRPTTPSTSAGPFHLHIHVSSSSNSQPMSEKAHKMVIKMLVTVTTVFFACYLPYHIERLIVWYSGNSCDRNPTCIMLYPITGLLQYISATLNPVIYNVMSQRFRSAFYALLRRIVHPQSRRRGRGHGWRDGTAPLAALK